MKLIISVILFLVSINSYAGVFLYKNDTTVLGLEESKNGDLITSTLYGGSNNSGANAPADCIVKYKLTKNGKNFDGSLIPFSSYLMGYGDDSNNIAMFEVHKDILTFTTNEYLSVCPLGTDFTGDYNFVAFNTKEYKSNFDDLIKFNHTNALKVFKRKSALEASKFLEPYISESISQGYYYETIFNDYGYLLQQAEFNKEAIDILTLVIHKSPKRAVAYLNIADAYWNAGDKMAASKSYNDYISLMKYNNQANKIPQHVIDRVK